MTAATKGAFLGIVLAAIVAVALVVGLSLSSGVAFPLGVLLGGAGQLAGWHLGDRRDERRFQRTLR